VSAAHVDHLDYDTLADLAEGLLSESRAASADAHLASCAECQDRSAEISDVSRLLAETPAPPMPAELASRIDAALAAEAATSGPVVSLEAHRHRRRLRVLSVAAATAVVVGGGALVGYSVLNGSVSTDSGSGSAQSPALQDRTGSAKAKPPGSETLQGARGYSTVESGTNYTAAGLGRQVSTQLTPNADGKRAALTTQAITSCVQSVAKGKRPLLVDIASYEGRPATVIVLPGTDANRVDVWVVVPSCSPANPAVITHTQATR
jgi:anti-sigma factor RsiW